MVRLSGYSPTGDLDFDGVGTTERAAASAIATSLVLEGSLSALVTALAETDGLELYAEWQVSNDNATWHVCQAATTALATGTAGADTEVSRVIPAPASAYGWKLARMTLRVEVVNGTTDDTYSIAYNAVKDQS